MKTILRKKTFFKRLEGFLFRICLAVFMIMLGVQISFISPGIRSIFFNDYTEGYPLESEAYLFIPCKMELKLTNMGFCPELKVLVNGVEADSFRNQTVLLNIKDGDIVELDSNKVLVAAEVKISAVSQNISGLLGRTFTVKNGIETIAVINTDSHL